MEMQTGAQHELKIPNRAMIFLGPQRCGKTTSVLASLWLASKHGKIIIVCNHAEYAAYWRDDFRINGNLDNVIHMPVTCADSPARLKEHGVTLKDISAIGIIESSVFVRVGLVRVWKKPSRSFKEFMEVLCEPTAMSPKIFIEANLEGHENDVAVG